MIAINRIAVAKEGIIEDFSHRDYGTSWIVSAFVVSGGNNKAKTEDEKYLRPCVNVVAVSVSTGVSVCNFVSVIGTSNSRQRCWKAAISLQSSSRISNLYSRFVPTALMSGTSVSTSTLSTPEYFLTQSTRNRYSFSTKSTR